MLKTFISFKWECEDHNDWVEKFSRDLRAAGIDTQLDKWEIRFGDSIQNYMTSRIDDSDVVLCVITDEYVRRVDAPDGEGGYVQFEMELANARKLARDKEVRVIGVYGQGSQTPTYLRAHLYVDFRDDSQYAERFRELVDDLRDKPKRLPLGVPQLKELELWKNTIGMKMAPAGEFVMGSADIEDAPPHSVRRTEPFLIGIHPVTQQRKQFETPETIRDGNNSRTIRERTIREQFETRTIRDTDLFEAS